MTATDVASTLAGTDGGRPRRTRTGPNGVDLSQVPAHRCGSRNRDKFQPKSVPAHRRLRVPVGLRDHLPDLAGRVGGMDVRAPPGLAQHIRRTP